MRMPYAVQMTLMRILQEAQRAATPGMALQITLNGLQQMVAQADTSNVIICSEPKEHIGHADALEGALTIALDTPMTQFGHALVLGPENNYVGIVTFSEGHPEWQGQGHTLAEVKPYLALASGNVVALYALADSIRDLAEELINAGKPPVAPKGVTLQ